MPGILSTNNPVVKVSGLRPSTLKTGLLVLLSNCVQQEMTNWLIISLTPRVKVGRMYREHCTKDLQLTDNTVGPAVCNRV